MAPAAVLRKAMMEKSAAAVRTKLPTTLAKVIAPRVNAFFLFNKDERPKVQGEGLKSSEVMKELGRRWSSLGDAGQAPYIAQALKAKSNAPPPPTGTEPVLRVKGEAQIAKLAVTASNAAIEGFFAGLTEMTEAELASNMSMKNVGSLKMVHVDGTVVLTFKPRKPTGEGSPPKK